jgi:hypothetical protein
MLPYCDAAIFVQSCSQMQNVLNAVQATAQGRLALEASKIELRRQLGEQLHCYSDHGGDSAVGSA